MSANADTLYLPVLAPAKVEVHYESMPRRRRPLPTWQQRVYRIPRTPRPQADGIAYGADGTITPSGTNGKLIDIFA